VSAKLEWLAANLLVLLDLGQRGGVVGPAQGGSLMAESSLGVWHYFFSRCKVCLRKFGLYFITSKRSVVLRLFFVVV
jgi:hypothetical protein